MLPPACASGVDSMLPHLSLTRIPDRSGPAEEIWDDSPRDESMWINNPSSSATRVPSNEEENTSGHLDPIQVIFPRYEIKRVLEPLPFQEKVRDQKQRVLTWVTIPTDVWIQHSYGFFLEVLVRYLAYLKVLFEDILYIRPPLSSKWVDTNKPRTARKSQLKILFRPGRVQRYFEPISKFKKEINIDHDGHECKIKFQYETHVNERCRKFRQSAQETHEFNDQTWHIVNEDTFGEEQLFFCH